MYPNLTVRFENLSIPLRYLLSCAQYEKLGIVYLSHKTVSCFRELSVQLAQDLQSRTCLQYVIVNLYDDDNINNNSNKILNDNSPKVLFSIILKSPSPLSPS